MEDRICVVISVTIWNTKVIRTYFQNKNCRLGSVNNRQVECLEFPECSTPNTGKLHLCYVMETVVVESSALHRKGMIR